MDTKILKALMINKLDTQSNAPDAVFGFNQKYSGAKFDLEKLATYSWKELQRDEAVNGIWLEKVFALESGKILEFRIYLSLMGHWRETQILVFSNGEKLEDIRTQAKSIPSEIASSVSGEFDSAIVEGIPTDFDTEMVRVSDYDPAKIPSDMSETDYRLAIWRNLLEGRLEKDPSAAKRLISCALRQGHFCTSGKTIAYAAFVAYEIGMRLESSMLMRHAVEEDADNSYEYWNCMGCVMERLKFSGEAFECFKMAHSMKPEDKTYRANIWVAGRKLIPELLMASDFQQLVRHVQTMLGCAEEIKTGEKVKFICALGLAYEGKGDSEEAAVYYSLAMKTAEIKDKDGKNEGEESPDFHTALCPMAVFGLNRLKEKDDARRSEAFSAQVKSFPQTPAEAGWLGRVPVRYIEGVRHGEHWSSVIADMEERLVSHIKVIVKDGVTEGTAEYAPSETGFGNFEKAAGFEYPPKSKESKDFLKAFVISGKHMEKDSLEVCSAFPVFGTGTHVELLMDRVDEWINGLEANASMTTDDGRIFEFFIPDYYRDRLLLKKDCRYDVELAGFAYYMEMFSEKRFDIDEGPMLEIKKEELRKEGKPDDIKSVPLYMNENASFLNPRLGSDDAANCDYLGKVAEVSTSQFFGSTVYRVVVQMRTDGDGNEIRLPVFIGKHRLDGFVPEVGMAVSGVLWLQGILRKELGMSRRGAGSGSETGTTVWTKDFEDFCSHEGYIRHMLGNRLMPSDMRQIGWSLDCDPDIVLRLKSGNLFVHTTIEEVKDEKELLQKMSEIGARIIDYNKSKGILVEQVGIGLVKAGPGHAIKYAGFDELGEKYGKK